MSGYPNTQILRNSTQVWGGTIATPADVVPTGGGALEAFLRAAHPHDTAKHVAKATGASRRTVENWLDGSARPGFDHTLSLIRAYRMSFVSACLPGLVWVDAAARAERLAALEAEAAAVRGAYRGAPEDRCR